MIFATPAALVGCAGRWGREKNRSTTPLPPKDRRCLAVHSRQHPTLNLKQLREGHHTLASELSCLYVTAVGVGAPRPWTRYSPTKTRHVSGLRPSPCHRDGREV